MTQTDHYRVLIVDDHPDVRRMLHAWVQTLGAQYEVLAIPSGEEAILEATRQTVDLLIADFRLPGINGLELMSKIKRRCPELKVILLTGINDPKIRRQVAAAGADAFFIKPIQMPELVEAIQRILTSQDTFLPIPPVIGEAPVPKKVPSVSLSELRQATQATAAYLLDDRGEVLASAGHLPDEAAQSSLIQSISSVYHAGVKVSYSLGTKIPQNIMYFSGAKVHLCVVPVGAWNFILLAFDPARIADFPPADHRPFYQAAREIFESLGRFGAETTQAPNGAPDATAVPEPSIEPEKIGLMPANEELQVVADDADLSEIFKKQNTHQDPKEVHSFWEAAVEKGRSSATSASALSYDEARRLGLAPEDNSGE